MCANVAVLGLGIMGSAMARDAARAGMNVTAWDRSPDRASRLAADKVHLTPTPVNAVPHADVVVTMVSDADAVLNVMQERGAFAAMKSGAAWVQMSTIGVEGTDRALRLAATRPEIVFVDAPVSGSKEQAEEGKLIVLASGDHTRTGTAVQQFFNAIGAQAFWLGNAGEGTRMKLMFNAWLAVLMEAVAEVAILGDALGVDPERFVSLTLNGPLVPPWASAKLKKIADKRTAETEFPLRWAHKDVRLALAAAGEDKSHIPVLNQIAATWADALPDFGTNDLSAIYLALRQQQATARN